MALSEFPRLGFDPFVELRRMQSEMNRLFSGFTPTTRDFPPINIWLGENSGVTITSSLRSDMRSGNPWPTIIPCRDPTSGIRHAFDLVIPWRCSSGRTDGGSQG
jgi:hypothetical protein